MKVDTRKWAGEGYAKEYEALEGTISQYTLVYIAEETRGLNVIDIYCIRKKDETQVWKECTSIPS